MLFLRFIALSVAVILLASCTSKTSAPFIDKSKNRYSRNSIIKSTESAADTNISSYEIAPIGKPKENIVMESPKYDSQIVAKPTTPSQAEVKSIDTPAETKALTPQIAENEPRAFKIARPMNLSGFDWPVSGKITSGYGAKGNKFNEGLEISASLGSNVLSAGKGKVIYIGKDVEGYGNLVIIKHDKDIMTAYAHLNEISVERGAEIEKGSKIGTVGSQSKDSTEGELHFSARKGKKTIDPEKPL